VNLKERHTIIRPIKKAGFTYSESRNLGFNISKKLWRTCLNENPRNLGEYIVFQHELFIPLKFLILKNKGGRRRIDSKLIKDLRLHLKNNSRISSDRIIKNKTDCIETPVRYLNDAKIELYKKLDFNQVHLTKPYSKSTISKSTFDKYTKAERYIKKIQRKTDVCDFCDWMRVKSKTIVTFCSNFPDFEPVEDFNPMQLIGII